MGAGAPRHEYLRAGPATDLVRRVSDRISLRLDHAGGNPRSGFRVSRPPEHFERCYRMPDWPRAQKVRSLKGPDLSFSTISARSGHSRAQPDLSQTECTV